MYQIKNLLTQAPDKLTAAAMAVLNVPILLGLWSPDEKAVAGINLALVSVLALFYVGPTVAAQVAVAAKAAHAAGVNATVHYLTANAPKAAAKPAAKRRARSDAGQTVVTVLVIVVCVLILLWFFGMAHPRTDGP